MDDLRDRMTVMPEIELSSSQQRGSTAAPIPAASRRLCPYCQSVETARSHRRGPIEKYLLRAIRVRVYRCDDCDTRFYAFSRFDATPSPKKVAP
jgi:hypothetical protein